MGEWGIGNNQTNPIARAPLRGPGFECLRCFLSMRIIVAHGLRALEHPAGWVSSANHDFVVVHMQD